jgi:peptidoglycan/LPS O-acetylase OafA/YrhL
MRDNAAVLPCRASTHGENGSIFTWSRPVLDSVSASSYGMYLAHYVFVVWWQYWLLAAPIPSSGRARPLAHDLG